MDAMHPIFLIMGTPACGKSTVSRALLSRFERGLHIPVDDLRHMVVSGLCEMGFESTEGLELQLRLARESAARMARAYAEAGFAVAIDDFWYGDTPDAHYSLSTSVHRIVLNPSLEATLARLYGRNPDEGSFKAVLEQAICELYPAIQTHPRVGWCAVDSSHLSVEQTVDLILERTHTQPG